MMETTTKLYAQIAAAAGTSKDEAQAAAYMLDLSREGKTLDQVAALMRRRRGEVRNIARDWGIPFPDYTPRSPVILAWMKIEGGWVLHQDGEILASITKSAGGYRAEVEGPIELSATALTIQKAAKALSVEIDLRSREIVGADDVRIDFPDGPGGGGMKHFAPTLIGSPAKLRSALGSAHDA